MAGELEIVELLSEFVELTDEQYEAEKIYDPDVSGARVIEKCMLVEKLDALEPEGRTALLALLNHHDLAVRVSVATHLLAIVPERALPVLATVAAFKTSEELQLPNARRASIHAQQAIWMYEDGNLKLPEISSE